MQFCNQKFYRNQERSQICKFDSVGIKLGTKII